MYRLSKHHSLYFVAILAFSVLLMIAESTDAQTIPKPTVPQFTVKYVDRSYTVPATTTIDPYSGQSVTNPSHYVENRTLEIAIKNQPFTPYIDNSTGAEWKITLMYQIRTKGHFAQNWTNLYSVDNGFLSASNSSYTTVSYPLSEGSPVGGNLEANDQVDFQVKAMIGYVHRTVGFMSWYFTGESSDWSPTQTVTIPASNSNPSPTVPEFPFGAVLSLFALVPLIAIMVKKRLYLKAYN
jgi:hypothetical protein